MKPESTGGFYTQIRNDDGLRLFKDGTEISVHFFHRELTNEQQIEFHRLMDEFITSLKHGQI